VREATLSAREQAIAAREALVVHQDHVAFAESLVAGGKLTPASKDKVVAILDAAPGHAAVSFAAGAEKLSLGTALRELLEAQPKIVSFGAMDMPEGATPGREAAFAADGRAVDPARLALHNKALDFQRKYPATTYDAAVRAVA